MLSMDLPVSLNGVLSADFNKLAGAVPSTTVWVVPKPLVYA